MNRLLIAALAAASAACFSPKLPGIECGENGFCPNGLSCDFDTMLCDDPSRADIDAAVIPDAPPTGDRDGDGFADNVDNCPTIDNPEQYDEDLDTVGDVCDNCPGIPNTDQRDELELTPDGVGDVCDPNPTVAGDSILFFDPFNEVRDQRWQQGQLSNDWNIVDGHLVSARGARDVISLDLGINSGRAETRVMVTVGNADEVSVGVVGGLSASGAISCGHFSVLDDPQMGTGGLYEVGLNIEPATVLPQPVLQTNDVKLYAFDFDNDSARCGFDGLEVSDNDLNPDPGDPRLGIGSSELTASFGYFIVYARSAP